MKKEKEAHRTHRKKRGNRAVRGKNNTIPHFAQAALKEEKNQIIHQRQIYTGGGMSGQRTNKEA